jgi:hypothetical protein
MRYLVHFGYKFGHAEEVFYGFLDMFGTFDKEVVYGLGRGDGCLDCRKVLSNVISRPVFDEIDDVAHARFQ